MIPPNKIGAKINLTVEGQCIIRAAGLWRRGVHRHTLSSYYRVEIFKYIHYIIQQVVVETEINE